MKSFSGFLLIGLLVQSAFADLPKNKEYLLATVRADVETLEKSDLASERIMARDFKNYLVVMDDLPTMTTAYSFAKGLVSEEKMSAALNAYPENFDRLKVAKVRRIEQCFGSNCIPVFGIYAGRSPN